MIKNKRGLSAIIITVIMIALVLVAVGVVWAVYKNVIEGRVEQIDLGTKCMEVDVKPTVASCASVDSCNVTISRGAGGDAIGGVKIVYYSGSTGGTVISSVGNIAPLGTKQVDTQDSGLGATPDEVQVTVYFTDDSGNEQLCTVPTSIEFS